MKTDVYIKKIVEDTGLSKKEIQNLIEAKKEEIKGLISDEGALFVIAKELGVEVLGENREPLNEIHIMNEFVINKFLSLRFEDGKTNIYINNKLFRQCKFLLLDIPIENIESFNEIESIDEAADILGWRNEGQESVEYDIDSNTEFWGHCSNLQAWYEYEYDTRLLHSNLAFSLLKRLTEVGDPLAKKVYKEQIASRFESGYPTTIAFIIEENLLNCFEQEELEQLIEQNFSVILTTIRKLSDQDKYRAFSALLKVVKEKGLIEKHSSVFLKILDEIPVRHKYNAFSDLIGVVKEVRLTKEQFLDYLEYFDNLPYYRKYDAFSDLIRVAKAFGLLKELFPSFLKTINILHDRPKYEAISDLIRVAKEIGLIKELFPTFLMVIGNIPYNEFDVFSDQFKVAKATGIRKEHFPIVAKTQENIPYHKYDAFSTLFIVLEETGFTQKHFSAILKAVDKLHDEDKYRAFYDLIDSIKYTDLIKKNHIQIENQVLVLLSNIDKIPDTVKNSVIRDLIVIAKITGFKKRLFHAFLERIVKITTYHKYEAFSKLINVIKDTELKNEYYLRIEAQFLSFMKSIKKLPDDKKYRAFSDLFNLAKEINWIKEHFLVILETINKLPNEEKYFSFFKLIDLIRYTEVFNEHNSIIEAQFLVLLNDSNKLTDYYSLYDNFERLIDEFDDCGLLDKNFPAFLNVIDNLLVEYKFSVFSLLFDSIKRYKILNKYYSQIKTQFLNLLESLDDKIQYFIDKYRAFSDLLKVANETGWIKEGVPVFLDAIDNLHDEDKYQAFSKLINVIKDTEVLSKYYTPIKTLFIDLLNNTDNMCECDDPNCEVYHKRDANNNLINAIKGTKLGNEVDFIKKGRTGFQKRINERDGRK